MIFRPEHLEPNQNAGCAPVTNINGTVPYDTTHLYILGSSFNPLRVNIRMPTGGRRILTYWGPGLAERAEVYCQRAE